MSLSNWPPLSRYKISGHSMEPTYQEGQVVWVYNWAYLFSKPKVEDVILCQLDNKIMIKRVQKITSEGVEVRGDNQTDSFDSRQFGVVKFSEILGRVT